MPINSKECEGEESESRLELQITLHLTYLNYISSDCTGGDCPSITNGTIKSTNFPSNYPDNDDVTIPLMVEAGSTIRLTFTDFDLEVDSGCAYDYVKVLDTDGTTQMAKLCGDSIPSPIKSSGNNLTVVFHSDYSVNKKGFQATWSKVPGESSGEVTSPDYPSSYPNNQQQVKTISVPEGAKIELTFTNFYIEFYDNNGSGITCPYDKLTIYDSADASGNKLAVRKSE